MPASLGPIHTHPGVAREDNSIWNHKGRAAQVRDRSPLAPTPVVREEYGILGESPKTYDWMKGARTVSRTTFYWIYDRLQGRPLPALMVIASLGDTACTKGL